MNKNKCLAVKVIIVRVVVLVVLIVVVINCSTKSIGSGRRIISSPVTKTELFTGIKKLGETYRKSKYL